MNKRKIFALLVVCFAILTAMTGVFSSGYLTDRKRGDTYTLKSAKLDNEISMSLSQSYINSAEDTTTMTFSIVNNSNTSIANCIEIKACFEMANDANLYDDDISAMKFYPGTMSDSEIYSDVRYNNAKKAYDSTVEYGASDAAHGGYLTLNVPEINVPAQTSMDFPVKIILDSSELSGYGNIISMNINAEAKTKNAGGGYGFSEDLGSKPFTIYDNINTDENNTIVDGEQWINMVDVYAVYGVESTESNPVANFYEILPIRDKDDIYIVDDTMEFKYCGLKVKNGKLFGTPTVAQEPTIPDFVYFCYNDGRTAGSANIYTHIQAYDISDNISISEEELLDWIYSGYEICPEPSVTNDLLGVELKKDTDYSLSYSNNINAGTATVTITGKGNYTGTITKTFEIAKCDISAVTVGSISSYTYTGSAFTPTPTITYNSKTLTKNTDYTLSYSNNTNAGTATVTIVGKGNFTGTTSKTFAINKRAISSATVGTISSYTYTGSAFTPTPTITYNSKTLTKNTDYTLSYSNNTNAGTATVTIAGKGNFTGTTSKTFTIKKASQTAPETLEATADSLSKISLTSIEGAEYSKDGIMWQSSNIFANLEEETVYTFYARYKETDNYCASANKTVEGICSNYSWNTTSTGKIGTLVTGFSSLGADLTIIDIPERATGIASSAFLDNVSVVNITNMGNNITSIGSYAFRGCSGLKGNLTIPNGVTSIGSYAFYNCSGFTGDLIMPNSVTSVGAYAFYGCKGFNGKLTISSNVTSIANYTFRFCSGFTGNLTIPNGVTSIGEFAFQNCSGFTGDLIIPNNVTSIGTNAFYGCKGFKGELHILSNKLSIGNSAFSGCSGFTGNLTIPNGVTSIGRSAFISCSGFTGNLTIPNGVTSIGEFAFQDCSGFTGDLIIPNSVTSIGTSAFVHCNGINNIIIDNEEDAISGSPWGADATVIWSKTLSTSALMSEIRLLTPSPTPTVSPISIVTPSPTPTVTPSPTPTTEPTPTVTPSPTPTTEPTPTVTQSPTSTPSPIPMVTPSPTPTVSPTPTITPSPTPTIEPTAIPEELIHGAYDIEVSMLKMWDKSLYANDIMFFRIHNKKFYNQTNKQNVLRRMILNEKGKCKSSEH